MKILTAPDPFLSRACAPVEFVTEGAIERIEDMLALMHKSGGVGLAAPQVGWDARVFVMNEHAGENTARDWDMAWVNPSWSPVGVETAASVEGCLSLPGVSRTVRRYRRVVVKGICMSRADRGPLAGKLLLCGLPVGDTERDPLGTSGEPSEWDFFDYASWMRAEDSIRLGSYIVQHECDHLDGRTIAEVTA